MPPPMPSAAFEEAAFSRLLEAVRQSRVPHVVHAHAPTRTMEEAARNLTFNPARLVKTVAFATRSGGLVLAALRGTRRVAYPLLAALLGLSRRDLSALAPEEVLSRLHVAPGSVSPVALDPAAPVWVDLDVLSIAPTLYCGCGRPDRTLEIAPDDLVFLAGGRAAAFSKQ